MMASFDVVSVEEANENILVLRMHSGSKGQNAINIKFVKAFNKALDYCENTKGERSLIITGSADKFFSVGFDFAELIHNKNIKKVKELVAGLLNICHRLLTFPMPIIAAINGHCYAGGVMLALCCDYRIMLKNCGDFCLSEVHLGLSFPIGFRELIAFKMTPNTLKNAALRGYKFSCTEALNAGLIDDMTLDRNELLTKSINLGKSLAPFSQNRKNLCKLKHDIYQSTIDALIIAKTSIFTSKL